MKRKDEKEMTEFVFLGKLISDGLWVVSEQGAGLCAHTQSHPYLTQTYVIIHTAEHMPPCLDIPSAQRQFVQVQRYLDKPLKPDH